jgi:hypothetical protein
MNVPCLVSCVDAMPDFSLTLWLVPRWLDAMSAEPLGAQGAQDSVVPVDAAAGEQGDGRQERQAPRHVIDLCEHAAQVFHDSMETLDLRNESAVQVMLPRSHASAVLSTGRS